LGLKQGRSESEAVYLVHQALDAGINLFDTSERNGTEPVLGAALKDRDRSQFVLSTKRSVSKGTRRLSPAELAAAIDNSLATLRADYIDVFSFHGVFPHEYDFVVGDLLPVLNKARSAGKVRFCGITEAFKNDTRHKMLQRAFADDHWDVSMVGYNLLNFSFRKSLAAKAQEKNIGILGMYAVRNLLRSEALLSAVIGDLKASGQIRGDLDVAETLKSLLTEGDRRMEVPELAYRFSVTDSPVHCSLMGTGNPLHLKQNLVSFDKPPLSQLKMRAIEQLFDGLDTLSGH
jgi:aryl-alcohol dehydrogenase-like predicted oxidoreductase